MRFKWITIAVSLFAVLSLCGCEHQSSESAGAAQKDQAGYGETQNSEATDAIHTNQAESCEHQWSEATCIVPKTCTVCGEAEGEALGHTTAARQMTNLDSIALIGEYTTVCQTCGEVLETESLTITSLHEEDHFLLTPNTFQERIDVIVYEHGFMMDPIETESDTPSQYTLHFLDERRGFEVISVCEFFHDGIQLTDEQAEEMFSEIRVKLGINLSIQEMFFTNTSMLHVMPVVMTCDPSLDYFDAQDIFDLLYETGAASANGIAYRFDVDPEEGILTLFVQLDDGNES